MRRVVLLVIFLSFSTHLYAAPCYGTKMPERKQLFLGTETHSIFKRYLGDGHGKLRSLQHFLLITYGVFDWFSIDLKGGAGYIKQHPVGGDEVDYPSDFAGGYGFRLRVFEKGKIKAVFGFQHISVHPEKVHLEGIKNTAVLDDWQWSACVSYDFGKITPYLGTRWSRVDYIHWVEEDRKRRMSDMTKDIGLILGLDLSLSERIWLNLEGSLIDSEAFSFSLNYSF
ncbi:hypothetical protein ACFLZ3_02705 [Candidatus Omnitrophota bacterium]